MPYRVWQVAKFIGATETTVRKMAADGAIRAYKTKYGRSERWAFDATEIAAFLSQHGRYLKNFRSYKPTKELEVCYANLEQVVDSVAKYSYTRPAVAQILDIPVNRVLLLIQQEKLKAHKERGNWAVYEEDLVNFILQRPYMYASIFEKKQDAEPIRQAKKRIAARITEAEGW